MRERGCEALLNIKTIDPGSTRNAFDFEGRKHDRGPSVEERNAVEEVTISCEPCNLGTTLQVEGRPPFGAFNEASRQGLAFLKKNCGKWKERVERERSMGRAVSDTPPDSWMPR